MGYFTKRRLMELGMGEETAKILARGRKFYGQTNQGRKPILQTDWEELYDIFIAGAFPMGFDVDESIKESHKRGFMNLLSHMKKKLIAEVEESVKRNPHLAHLGLTMETVLNWNKTTVSHEFLNWEQNPFDQK